MIDLSHVRSFLAVLDAGSFRAASQRLGVSQPTVSKHLGKLEASLGVPLVERGRAACRPTEAGATFRPFAESLITIAERAHRALDRRELVLGACSNIGVYLLPRYLRAFAGQEPAVDALSFNLGTNLEVAERLANREVDLALMEWWDGRPGFEGRVWRREPLVVIVAPGHPWAEMAAVPRELLFDAPMFGGEPGTGTGRLLREAFGEDVRRLRVVAELGSTEAVKQAVKARLGVSMVIASAVEDETRSGELVALPLAEAPLVKEMYVVLPEAIPEQAPARLFAAMLTGAEV